MSAVTISSLPDELLRAVHGYLCPPEATHCVMHDEGAGMRAACKLYRRLLTSETQTSNCCVSLQEACHFKYGEVCERLSYTGHVHSSTIMSQPSRVCIVHDCCNDYVDHEVRMECAKALASLSKQVLLGKEALSFYFRNWSSVDMFQRLLTKTKVRLAPKYSPVVTRAVKGLRVSWIKSRLPKYYPLVAFHKEDVHERNDDETAVHNVDTDALNESKS